VFFIFLCVLLHPAPISDRLSKSTSGLRPVKPKTVGQPSSSSALSKTTPSKTTPTRGTRPGTSSGIPQIRSTTKPKAMPPSSRPQTVKRPVTAPEAARGGRSSRLPLKHSVGESGAGGKKKVQASPASSPRISKPALSSGTTPKDKQGGAVSGTRARETNIVEIDSGAATLEDKQGGTVGDSRVKGTRVVEIDEFFGEGKKTSQKVRDVVEDEDGNDLGVDCDSEEEEELDQDCVRYGNDSQAEFISAISSSLEKKGSR